MYEYCPPRMWSIQYEPLKDVIWWSHDLEQMRPGCHLRCLEGKQCRDERYRGGIGEIRPSRDIAIWTRRGDRCERVMRWSRYHRLRHVSVERDRLRWRERVRCIIHICCICVCIHWCGRGCGCGCSLRGKQVGRQGISHSP
jgi:hypothetical protein